MASTPAPLPSLGLLDGLGTAGTGNTDSPAPLPHLGLLGGLGTASAPVDDRQGVIEHPLPMAWHADPGYAAAYAWYALGVLVANRDEATPPPPPASGGSGGAAYLPHIGLLLETAGPPPPPSGGSGAAAFLPHIGLLFEAAPEPAPSPAAVTNKAGGRTYVIRGRRYYNLTNEQLAYLLANELIDVQRSDIRVQYGNKDRRITRGDFAAIVKQSKASQATKAAAMEWDDEEEAALLLL